MEMQYIPKTFWHSLSLAILALTFGLLVIAYRSSSVSIEIANAKVELSSAISTTQEIRSGLVEENERLKAARTELESKIRKMEATIASLNDRNARVTLSREISELKLRAPTVSNERWEQLNRQIGQAQQAIAPRSYK